MFRRARNRLKDGIVDVKEGASPANVKIKVGGGIIRLPITDKWSSSSNLQGAQFLSGARKRVGGRETFRYVAFSQDL